MTRLSNGFSRKRANLRAALALFFVYYNFCKFHKSIRRTPAMEAGLPQAVEPGGPPEGGADGGGAGPPSPQGGRKRADAAGANSIRRYLT